MGIRIWWQDIFPSEKIALKNFGLGEPGLQTKLYGKLIEVVKQAARDDTEVEVHHVKHSAYAVASSYLEMINNLWIIDGIIDAEKQGYDAAIIGCGNDPGLQQARQAVDIPVVGPTEAGMLLACMLGHKFGVITVADELISICDRNVHNYGLDYRVTMPVRVYQLGSNPFEGLQKLFMNPETINPQFEELCRASIADGAEVIIPACCALSPATSLLGYKEVPGTGVPVIDITQAAVKMAEMLVDLKRTVGLGKSQKGWYKSLGRETRDYLRQLAQVIV